MLTEEYLKANLVRAHFIDNDRKTIEVLTRDLKKGGQNVESTIIEYDEKHPYYQALIKVCSLDQLHENTYNQKKEERALFEKEIMEIAKREGLVTEVDTNTFSTKLIEYITKDEENEDHLFALKLSLFELDKIRNSKNNELKKQMRQGKTKTKVLLPALKIICEE